MKQARITERKPIRRGRQFWYVLEVVDAPTEGREPLQHASARWLWADASQVDPDERRTALASLNAWAEENGWMVVA